MICRSPSSILVLPRIRSGKNFKFLCHGPVRRLFVWVSLFFAALHPFKVVAEFDATDSARLADILSDTRSMRGNLSSINQSVGGSWGSDIWQFAYTNYLTDRIWLDWQRSGLQLQTYGVSMFEPMLDVAFPSSSHQANQPKIQDALIALASLNPNQKLITNNGNKEMLGFGQLFYGYSSNSYAAAHNSIHSNGIFYAVNDMARNLRSINQTLTNIAFYVSSPPYNDLAANYSGFVTNQQSWLQSSNIYGFGSSLDYLRALLFDIPGNAWPWAVNDYAMFDEPFMNQEFVSFLSDSFQEERLLHYYYYGNGNSPGMNEAAIALVNKYTLEPEYIPTDLEYSNDVNKVIKNSTNNLVKYESVAPTDYDTSWVDEMQDFLNYDNNEIPGTDQDAPDLWEIIEGQGLLGYEFHFTPSVEGATPIDAVCADFLNFADISPTLEKIKDFNTKLLKLAKYLMYFGFWIMLAFRTMHEIREFIG